MQAVQTAPSMVTRTGRAGWWAAFGRLRLSVKAALVVMAVFLVAAIAAPVVAPYDPFATNFMLVRKAPSLQHLMGTDEAGRDVLSRVIFGARASLMAAVVPVSLALLFSIPLGLLAGYMGRWVDSAIMRLTDAVLSIPTLLLAIALAAFLGPSLQNAMLAIGIASLPTFVRLARGAVLSIKEEEYIEAARAIGNSPARIAVHHILPNMMPPLLIQASITMATGIVAEASLSFLGLGQQPPAPSWGSMLNVGQRYLANAPWMTIWPGAVIFIVVLSVNVIGDALRDRLDPYLPK